MWFLANQNLVKTDFIQKVIKRYMGIHSCLFRHFTKGNNFRDFQFASLGSSHKAKSLLLKRKFSFLL